MWCILDNASWFMLLWLILKKRLAGIIIYELIHCTVCIHWTVFYFHYQISLIFNFILLNIKCTFISDRKSSLSTSLQVFPINRFLFITTYTVRIYLKCLVDSIVFTIYNETKVCGILVHFDFSMNLQLICNVYTRGIVTRSRSDTYSLAVKF